MNIAATNITNCAQTRRAFSRPASAPACYGEAPSRLGNRACLRCTHQGLCAASVDGLQEETIIWRPGDDGEFALPALPANIVLVGDRDLFAERVSPYFSRPAGDQDAVLRSIADGAIHDGLMASAPTRAYAGGLITVDAAREIAIWGEFFVRWLGETDWRIRPVRDVHIAGNVWVTDVITHRALLSYGPFGAFTPRLHHQVWQAVSDWSLSCNALRKRRPRSRMLFREFAERF